MQLREIGHTCTLPELGKYLAAREIEKEDVRHSGSWPSPNLSLQKSWQTNAYLWLVPVLSILSRRP
ncbi:hypothetical protein ARTHRO9V_160129 [Arthrobacter sp. 9V]|nr:hypothetical protein ARTHRO9V_160129 [Arthrobacter sp. 9V]